MSPPLRSKRWHVFSWQDFRLASIRSVRFLRYAGEYILFRLIGIYLRALPVEKASNYSGRFWRKIAPNLKRHKRALTHLALAFPQSSLAEREALALNMWENLGRTFAEAFHLDYLMTSDRILYDDPIFTLGEQGIRRAGVVCAPHIGNWELIVIGAVRAGLCPAGVYQKIKNPFVDRFVRKLRAPLYPGGLYPKGDNTLRTLLRHAKQGGTIAILADLRENQGVSVPFFGHLAPSNPFPAVAAYHLNLPIYIGAAVREPDNRFRMLCEEIPVSRTGNRKEDILRTTHNLQAAFERYIRQYPEQWLWTHKRWSKES